MKILMLLFLFISCASKNKNYLTLEIMERTHPITLKSQAGDLLLEKEGLPNMLLVKSNPDEGYMADIYMGQEDAKGEHWRAKEFSKGNSNWIYLVVIGTPESVFGQRILENKKVNPWTQVSKCVNDPKNKYLVVFEFGDMGGEAVGCIK